MKPTDFVSPTTWGFYCRIALQAGQSIGSSETREISRTQTSTSSFSPDAKPLRSNAVRQQPTPEPTSSPSACSATYSISCRYSVHNRNNFPANFVPAHHRPRSNHLVGVGHDCLRRPLASLNFFLGNLPDLACRLDTFVHLAFLEP